MDMEVRGKPLEQFRDFLCRLARGRFPARLQGKLDPSDIVQQTMLEAHAKRAQLRGDTPGEIAAWLRLMLLHNLADAGRAFRQDCRELDRERPLAGSSSSPGLGCDLAAEQSSPSQQAQQAELAAQLAHALVALPDGQREAIVLHYWHKASLAEIARELGRTQAAVAGLLKRGLKQLRTKLQEEATSITSPSRKESS
jgi:RNA polymerase sigma-70 factor (ECF subfamily)